MRTISALIFTCLFAVQGFAKDASPRHPVAVRWWGQGMVSIETYWNLTVVIDPHEGGYEIPELSPDIVLFSNPSRYEKDEKAYAINSQISGLPMNKDEVFFTSRTPTISETGLNFGRLPNDERRLFERCAARCGPVFSGYPHQMFLRAFQFQDSKAAPAVASINRVSVDGIQVLYCAERDYSKLTEEEIRFIGKIDMLFISPSGQETWQFVNKLRPRFVIPISNSAKGYEKSLEKFSMFKQEGWELSSVDHNTLAVSKAKPGEEVIKPQVVLLGSKPWQPKVELATLIEKMDASCKASQKVFAPLSVDQMNWRPPNGTHTPRWNTEHMMGRQLGFFSQIYAAIEPETFDHINLNPAQMPPDYKAAHKDWDGGEEARQMQRANAYVRRFAYLLEGLDLDKRAPGSRWTLRGLLKQMDRHYGEHTANVVKKFELEGWPEE